MWITTYHRFLNRAAFIEACQSAGWTCPPGKDPMLPQGVAMDIVGQIIGPPQIDEQGQPIAGEVIDPRYHVNLAWYGREPDAAFQASQVVPATPSRGWDIVVPPASPPPVPQVVPAWKGKAALREAGLLGAVEAAVAAAGGRVQDAWLGASEWERASEFLTAMAVALGLMPDEVDKLFRDANAIQG
ncbi:MAG: hypothetical protein NT133_01295 [Alphaproteobacteria bacterium]|nr:hypothetical protein [Alphaproteobacteria bacterium]